MPIIVPSASTTRIFGARISSFTRGLWREGAVRALFKFLFLFLFHFVTKFYKYQKFLQNCKINY